jgi:hypothetical protein
MQDAARPPTRRQPARGPRRRWRALGPLLALAPLVVSCDRGGPEPTAATTTITPTAPLLGADSSPVSAPATLPLPPDYQQPDSRGVVLRPALGRAPEGPPASPVMLTGGSARLTGTARGPDGPVAGATVRVERFVEDQVGRLDVTAGPDGTFVVRNLPGGRYRVRAWLRPFLTSTQSAVTFLAAVGGSADVALDLERHNAMAMQTSVGTRAWQVGQQVGVSALLTQEYVDAEGIARTGGVSGATITLQAPTGLALLTDAAAATGNDGYARWGLECSTAGQYSLTVEGNGLSRTIVLPECVPPPPPPTAPPPLGPAVGGTVTVPSAGPHAAGTYLAVDANAAACKVSFEVQLGESWVASGSGPVLQAPGPFRSLQPAAGSPACTYRRSA